MSDFNIWLEWQKSPAHIYFLSLFLKPATVEEVSRYADWKSILGEEAQDAVDRYLALSLVENCDLTEQMEHCFTVTDLKKMLIDRNKPVSGRKLELILRLIQEDPEGMKKAVTHMRMVFKCSEQGKEALAWFFTHQDLGPLYNIPIPPHALKKILEWVLLAATSGILGNRADDIVASIYEKVHERSVNKKYSSPSQPTNLEIEQNVDSKQIFQKTIAQKPNEAIEYNERG